MRYPILIAIGLLLALPAWAHSEFDNRDCVRGRGWSQVNACSRQIKSGRWQGSEAAWAYTNRGLGYTDLKQYRRAIQDYNEAIRRNPKYVPAYSNRGIAYRRLKQYRRAIQDYSEAIRLNPRFAKAYGNRGLAYEKYGQKQLAIRDYRMFLSLRPQHPFGIAGLKRLGVKA